MLESCEVFAAALELDILTYILSLLCEFRFDDRVGSDSTLGLATNTGSLSIIFFGFHEGRRMKEKLLFSGGKFFMRDDKEH